MIKEYRLALSRPSYEGRGLKPNDISHSRPDSCRPSYEGRGLKLSHNHTSQSMSCRPSYEGRGLKQLLAGELANGAVSPLVRGAWIETPAPR